MNHSKDRKSDLGKGCYRTKHMIDCNHCNPDKHKSLTHKTQLPN